MNFLCKYACFWEYVTSLTLSKKVQILNLWKGNFGVFIGKTFSTNAREKHSIFYFVLTNLEHLEDLELARPIFFFSSTNAFVASDLFWRKLGHLHAREPVILDRKIWSASHKEALSSG